METSLGNVCVVIVIVVVMKEGRKERENVGKSVARKRNAKKGSGGGAGFWCRDSSKQGKDEWLGRRGVGG